MRNIDLQAYAKFEDRSPFLFLNKAIIEQEKKSIAVINKDGRIPIPICTIACLLIGPGTTISHQAIINCVEGGCTLIWTGEEGVRFYAAGHDVYGKSKNICLQAEYFSFEKIKHAIARKMYQKRFEEIIPTSYTIEQIRGLEGNRVRAAYKKLSEKYNVKWDGRNYDRNNWNSCDPINRAITSANQCLYGVTTAAIISLGFSPQIGFVHHGFSTAFTCDIADLYKISDFLPIAFQVTSEGEDDIERRVRLRCRDFIKDSNFMKKIVKDIKWLFDDSFDT